MKKIIALAALFLFFAGSPAQAEDAPPDFKTSKLTGDWGGLRTQLHDAGYSFDLYYRVELWRNFSGGSSRGNRGMDDLGLQMSVDGEKAFSLNGFSAFVHLLNNNGGRINDIASTNGGISSIETSEQTFKLFQAWVQQNLWGDKLSVLLGLHDLNSEFYVTDTSGLFVNPTYGIGTEMAVTGRNGPSIFPTSGLTARVEVKPVDGIYIKAAAYDGVPGDSKDARGTHIYLGEKDGILLVAEGGLWSEKTGHFGVGVWKYTAATADLVTNTTYRQSKGVYFLADRSVYSADGRDISVFGRIGFTSGDVEQFSSNWSLGFVTTGFMPLRPEAQVGFAVSQNKNSDKYIAANTPLQRRETQYEFTVKDQITPWLSVQPDVQYTVNPGTDSTLKNALTAGVRLGIDF